MTLYLPKPVNRVRGHRPRLQACVACAFVLYPAGLPAPAHCAAKRNPEGEHLGFPYTFEGLGEGWAGGRRSFRVIAEKLLRVSA